MVESPCEVRAFPNIGGEVSAKEGEVIPSLRGVAIGDRKGL